MPSSLPPHLIYFIESPPDPASLAMDELHQAVVVTKHVECHVHDHLVYGTYECQHDLLDPGNPGPSLRGKVSIYITSLFTSILEAD